MKVDQEKLKADNSTLANALREKTRKHQRTQELYDRLKRKDMTAATQHAAYDSQTRSYSTRRLNKLYRADLVVTLGLVTTSMKVCSWTLIDSRTPIWAVGR